MPDRWLMMLECQRGHVCLWTQDRLAACTNHRAPIVKQLLAIPSAKLEMDGDDGVNVSFSPADIRAMLAILKPRKRRTLSDERRRALIEAGKHTRFAAFHGVQTREIDRRRDSMTRRESEVMPAA